MLESDKKQRFLVEFSDEFGSLTKDGEYTATGHWAERDTGWVASSRLTIGNLESGDFPWRGTLHKMRVFTDPIGLEEARSLTRLSAE